LSPPFQWKSRLILTFGDTARLFPETDAAILVALEEHESSLEWRYVYMYVSPLLPLSEGLLIERIDATETTLTVAVVSTAASAACPLCACSSARIHSRYTRSVADVACGGRQVKLVLSLRKFFCGTAICRRKIFTERLPDLVQPWARVTNRLLAALQALGLATSAQVSERLAPRLGMKVAAPTLLRCVRTIPDPPTAPVQMVGIDDWSLRRSQSYGTILVDLQSHRPIELLADRTAAAVLPWLKAHPDIDVVSRDRASAYADAAHKALPDAIQVADRFHVLKNLREHLQRFLERKRASLPFVEDTPLNKEPGLKAGSVTPTVTSSSAVQLEAASPITQQQSQHDDDLAREHPFPPVIDPEIPLDALTAVERRQKVSRDKRIARYEEVLALHRAGMGQRAIARQLRISRKVVHRSVTAEAFPERLSGTGEGRTSKLAPYLSYVRERWDAGTKNGRLLFREIKARGYPGSHGLLARVIAEWRTELPARPMQGTPRKPRLVAPKGQRRLSSRQASWLLLSAPEKRTEVQQQLLEHICQESPELHTAYLLTQEFVTLLKERQPEMLDGWLTRAKESGVSELGSFVKGIQRDYAAVRAACSLPWSNGVVEGHVNRLKFIKRSMFGRAKLDLLRVKVLHQI
jgi:transposase